MADNDTQSTEDDLSAAHAAKAVVVEEVAQRMRDAEGVLLTEYRGLSVRDLQELRSSLTAAGATYKVYKNTLVRRAADELNWDIADLLVGPTALAFVPSDIGAAAKALAQFAKSQPLLVLKGGMVSGELYDGSTVKQLADLPSGPEIYSKMAGGLAGVARGLAGGIGGTHRSLAQVLQAAIDSGAFADDGSAPAPEAEAAPADDASDSTDSDPAEDAENTESTEVEASASDTADSDTDNTNDDAAEEPAAETEES